MRIFIPKGLPIVDHCGSGPMKLNEKSIMIVPHQKQILTSGVSVILFQFVFCADSFFQIRPSATYIFNLIFFIFSTLIDCAGLSAGMMKRAK